MTATVYHWNTHGITDASELPHRIPTQALTPERLSFLQNKWWTRQFNHWAQIPQDVALFRMKFRTLAAHILSFGGHEVCMDDSDTTEHDSFDDLVDHGTLRMGDTARLMDGCHSRAYINCWELYGARKGHYQVIEGYALSLDGLWRHHFWLMDRKDGHIVETTESRLAYWGTVIGG